MCVVIGLQSTGEANTETMRAEQGDDGLDDFVSAPHVTLRRCAQRETLACRAAGGPVVQSMSPAGVALGCMAL